MIKFIKSLALASAALTVMTFGVGATAFASFYPADRQTYTCATPTSCVGANHVQFNSFTNNPVVGDERPFLVGGFNGSTATDRLKVNDGDVVVLRAYVHNNADPNLIGTAAALAHDVKIKFLIPNTTLTDMNMAAFISASNASPAIINDTMSVYADNAFNLDYVAGSAMWTTNAGTVAVPDLVVTDGAYLGDIHGCFNYSGYVTLRVKVRMAPAPVVQTLECSTLNLTVLDRTKRQVKATVNGQALNGAAISSYSIDFGDGTKVSQQTAEHTYAKDGNYTIVGRVTGIVNGQTVTVTSTSCAKSLSFNATPPTVIPSTGPTQTLGLFVGATVLSAIGYRLWMIRRLGN